MNKKFYIGICALFLALLTATMTSQAATFNVTNNSNGGAGSLRQAVLDANASGNANDTIEFTSNVRGKIVLTGFEIEIYKPIGTNLTINGPGANLLSIETNFAFRVFRVQLGNIKISGLQISRGFAPDGFFNRGGGIVVVEGAHLTLENCRITENQRGGIFTMSDSTLTINNSLIAGNDGGGIDGAGDLSVSNSTVSDNFGTDNAGIRWLNGTVTLTNITVSGNQGFDSGITFNTSNATILNSTITNNGRVSPAGNVGGLKIENGATVNLKNTIIADNLSSTIATDVSGTVVSQGNNLIGDTTGGSGFIASDLLNVNPMLGGFANNGGATYTHSLLAGSPAINAGNNTGAPATDQRGVARPQGAAVDIGAYESGVPVTSAATPTGSNVNTSLGSVSVTFSGVSLAGTTTQIPIDPAAAGTLPGGYSLGSGYPAFEITTTANYTAPIVVCIQVPNTTTLADFNTLRILHYVNGTPTDSTILPPDSPAPDFATKTICARVNSLSPFVVAQNLAPTAANVSVGGQVLTTNGSGISRAQVSITNQNGETRWTTTNSFGFYRFDEIPAGETYVISARHKVYQFNSQVLTVLDDIQNADFTAEPK